MTITVLSDVMMINALSSRMRGKQMRRNDRVPTDNGYEDINVVWSRTLRQYEFDTVPMTIAQWQAMEALHEVTEGGAYGFLMIDPKDSQVVTANGRMSLVSPGVYQLRKRYTVTGSTRYKDRVITRPRETGFAMLYDGEAIGGVTLDVLTGRVTIASPPEDPTLLTWSGSFYVPVHFLEDSIDWDLVAPGSIDQRFLAGPSVVLQEIRE